MKFPSTRGWSVALAVSAFAGAAGAQSGFFPVDFYFDGSGFVPNPDPSASELPPGLTTVEIPRTEPGEFPALVRLFIAGDNAGRSDDLLAYQRRDGFFASGLLLPGPDGVFAFRLDAGATDDLGNPVVTRLNAQVFDRLLVEGQERTIEYVLIGDTGEFDDSPDPPTDGRATEERSFLGGSFVGPVALDGVSALTGSQTIGEIVDRNAISDEVITYYVAVDTLFAAQNEPELPFDLELRISRPAVADSLPINEDLGSLSESVRLAGSTLDDISSPGTLADPQGRRASFVLGYRDAEGIIEGVVNSARRELVAESNEFTYRFRLPIASRLRAVDPLPGERVNDPLFFVLAGDVSIAQDVEFEFPPGFVVSGDPIIGPVIDQPIAVIALRNNFLQPGQELPDADLGEVPAGIYHLIVEGNALGSFEFDLDVEPVACNPGDLAAPFGVLSQTDVEDFVRRFFANDPIVAAYGPPFDVVSSGTVNSFLSFFFSGCPTD